VRIHREVRSKYSIAVHWGTYNMGSYEEFLAPKEELPEYVKKAAEEGKNCAPFVTVALGESVEVGEDVKNKVAVLTRM